MQEAELRVCIRSVECNEESWISPAFSRKKKKAGFQPNYYTYKIVVSTFSKNKDFEGAVDVLKDMLRRCIAPDKALLHEFFEGLSEAKKLHLAADLRSVANGARFISDVYYTGDYYRNIDEEKITC